MVKLPLRHFLSIAPITTRHVDGKRNTPTSWRRGPNSSPSSLVPVREPPKHDGLAHGGGALPALTYTSIYTTHGQRWPVRSKTSQSYYMFLRFRILAPGSHQVASRDDASAQSRNPAGAYRMWTCCASHPRGEWLSTKKTRNPCRPTYRVGGHTQLYSMHICTCIHTPWPMPPPPSGKMTRRGGGRSRPSDSAVARDECASG